MTELEDGLFLQTQRILRDGEEIDGASGSTSAPLMNELPAHRSSPRLCGALTRWHLPAHVQDREGPPHVIDW